MTSRVSPTKAFNLSILALKAIYLSILGTLGFAEGFAAFLMPAVQDAQDVLV